MRQLQAALDQLAELARATAVACATDVSEYTSRAVATLDGGGKILFCGNGGSAADAQHLAAEYVVRFARTRRALSAIALTTDSSVMTACANDLGFERVFARQVEALANPGDLLVLHSTSGESDNLLRAADAARSNGIGTVALLAKGGGRLRAKVDTAIVVPSDSVARAQEIHLAIGHVVCEAVEWTLTGDRP